MTIVVRDADGQKREVATLDEVIAGGRTMTIDRIYREGRQLTAPHNRVTNAGQAFTAGQALTGFSARPGNLYYIETLTLEANIDVEVQIERGDTSLITDGFGRAIHYTRVGPSYGAAIIPIRDFFLEGDTIFPRLMTAVAQDTPAFQFAYSINGKKLANDLAMEALNPVLVIGDSISDGVGVTATEELYTFLWRKWLGSKGMPARIISKAEGGWSSSHIDMLRKRKWLDVQGPKFILYNIGMNDASLAAFQANLPALLSWKQDNYPNAKMIVLGPSPRQGALETGVLQPIRAYEQTTISALGDPNIVFCSLANAFPTADDTYFFTGDATAAGARLHPNAAGHQRMFEVLRDFCIANAQALFGRAV